MVSVQAPMHHGLGPAGVLMWDVVDEVPTLPPEPFLGSSLRSALFSGDAQEVQKALSHDDTLVLTHVKMGPGWELPVVAAIRMGCSAAVLEVLLHHGASLTARSSLCDASALHILVLCLQQEQEKAKQSMWSAGVQTMLLMSGGGGLPLAKLAHEAEHRAARRGHEAEQQACAVAACLLQHGADATERWRGVLPAEAARQLGQHRLSKTIEHFEWCRCMQWMLTKQRSAANSVSPLWTCPDNVYTLIWQFLALPHWKSLCSPS